MDITRQNILKGNYIFPTELVYLKQTKHVKERILDRTTGLIVVPEYVRVTLDNIHSAKCDDGKHLHSVVVRLDYNKQKWLFMCLNPFDGALKTIWWTNKKHGNITQKSNSTKDNKSSV